MRLCMFHPEGHPLERGWVGRIDGDRVVQLASQTLQSFFTGGGSAREHAEYPLAEVVVLAPVLHPHAIRVFDEQRVFAFANPAAVVGPGSTVAASGSLVVRVRIAAVVGGEEEIAGFSVFGEWRDPSLSPPKDRDFALGLGPVVVTPDELDPEGARGVLRVDGEERLPGAFSGFDWSAARDFAAAGTVLRPGDLLAGPALGEVEASSPSAVELEVDGIGVLRQRVAG
ncbi:MAG: fumarylacetoacetate hydrolase family protein [Gaiellaceae bacterium]